MGGVTCKFCSALERERAVELTRAYQEGYEHGTRNSQQPEQAEPPALPDAAREAMQMALDALENAIDQLPKPYSTECARSADALRAALKEEK